MQRNNSRVVDVNKEQSAVAYDTVKNEPENINAPGLLVGEKSPSRADAFISDTISRLLLDVKHAYYGTNTRMEGIVVYAIVLFLLNAVISAVFIAKGLMIENGVITDMVMCPVAAGMMLIILIEMGIKHYIGKRADREE